MGYIYLRTNRINGKKYVGQTVDIEQRQYKWNTISQPYAGKVINAARNKYGINAFEFEILMECKDEEMNRWEMYYIKTLNTKIPNGYNLTDGGDGRTGYLYSEETRKKISEALKNRTFSEEHKINLSKANKGRKHTNESKRKMSEIRKGKHHSEETKIKISNSNKNNPTKSKPVLQIDITTNEVIAEFPSAMEVQRQLGYNQTNISDCCCNRPHHKTYRGYKWQFKTTT